MYIYVQTDIQVPALDFAQSTHPSTFNLHTYKNPHPYTRMHIQMHLHRHTPHFHITRSRQHIHRQEPPTHLLHVYAYVHICLLNGIYPQSWSYTHKQTPRVYKHTCTNIHILCIWYRCIRYVYICSACA